MTSRYFLRNGKKTLLKSEAKDIEKRLNHLESAAKPDWTARLSNISQVAMLGVILYGYIFTVIPVVQKEQIAEKLAQLEIEKQHWSSQLLDIKKELDEKQFDLIGLNKQIDNTRNEIQNLKVEQESTLSSLKSKSNELAKVNKDLVSAKRRITIAKNDLTKQIESRILGEDMISNSYLSVLDKYNETVKFTDEKGYLGLPLAKILWLPTDKDYTNAFINRFSQISPEATLDILIDEITEKLKHTDGIERDALEAISAKYISAKKSKKTELNCPTLPIDEWKATYNSLDAISDDFTSKCVDKTMDRFKELGTYTGQELHLNYYTSSCKRSINHEVSRFLTDEWKDVLYPCKERVTRLNEIVLKDLEEDQLIPFEDLRPPSIELIRTHMNNYVESNDFFQFDEK
ncbi:coiled-coil domain-containing protein [Vibrio splendidus]|uniref:coiled-coil domain-containing protein n=1 Tax=Vibrio splendidus TaxID=29497 RepID=UPI0002D50B63|nr:hypothetical protein [Vibrio splendidus]